MAIANSFNSFTPIYSIPESWKIWLVSLIYNFQFLRKDRLCQSVSVIFSPKLKNCGWRIDSLKKKKYRNPLLFEVSLLVVLVTCGQLWSETIKWKIPEVKVHVLYCTQFWVMKSHTLQFHPSQHMNHPFVYVILPVGHVVTGSFIRWKYHSFCIQVTLILLTLGPKAQE